MKYILNYGGGVNSTALIIELKNRGILPDYVIFSNTGEEMPETYTYLSIMREWFKKNNLIFIEVKSKYNKTLYNYYYDKKTLPWRKFRDCTDKFKKQPILNFIKQFKKEGVTQYIGISIDEFTRMKTSEVKWITLKYPLCDWRINREDCLKIIKAEGLPLPIKSGCYLCPYQSLNNWKKLYLNHKELFDKAKKLEENNRSYPKNTLLWKGNLKELENIIKTQKKLSDFDNNLCGGYCFL